MLLSSCNLLIRFSGEKKGSLIYKKKGVKYEAPILIDAKYPINYTPLGLPLTKTKTELKNGGWELESYQSRLLSDEASISYTLFKAQSNSYLNDISKKEIIEIKIIKDSIECKIANFKITSQLLNTRPPLAMAFILDHSGSMGDHRASALQEALDSALIYKNPKDEITIIKFDNRANKLITSSDINELRKFIKPTSGLAGYGSATALQDAIQLGISEINKTALKEKLIVVLTDGCENSSTIVTNVESLISNAKKSKVCINTLGFGDYVNDNYLNNISVQTGGYFTHFYTTVEISDIFKHVYYRINNNFKISFAPCMFGDNLKLQIKIKVDDSTFVNERVIYSPFNVGESIVLNVLFDVDKSNIKSDYINDLKSFISFLKQYPTLQIELSGHTDSDGDDDHNQKLSKNRAESIKKYLVENGISEGRITTVGSGELYPKFPNDSSENKGLNRRIEAKVI
jgi:hypothetical protein